LASGLEAYQSDQEQANGPIVERLKAVNDLLLSNSAQLERLLDLYLVGDFPQELLTERKVRLEQTIRSLKAEEAALEASLDAQQLTEEQIESIFEFVAVVREGLEEADDSFGAKRKLIELLDVRVTLAVENDEKIVYATCRLGKENLSVASNTT
jgi:hypothetical protein